MNRRRGFVSNSSTSCFLCDVCGTMEGFMGATLDEVGMVQCANDHTFCEKHMLDGKDMTAFELRDMLVAELKWWPEERDRIAALSEEELEDFFESGDGDDMLRDYDCYSAVSTLRCPICQFEHVTDAVAARYLMHVGGLTQSDLSAILKDNYRSFTEFKEKTK